MKREIRNCKEDKDQTRKRKQMGKENLEFPNKTDQTTIN